MKKLFRKAIVFMLLLSLAVGVIAVDGVVPVYAAEDDAYDYSAGMLSGDYGYNDLALRSNAAARQAFYRMLVEAAEAFDHSTEDLSSTVAAELDVSVLGLTMEELAETYYVMYYDHPQYYWMSNTFSASGVNDSLFVPLTIHEEYCSYATRSSYVAMLNTALQEYDAVVADLSGSFAISQAIHDKLIQDVEYAFQADGVTPCAEAYAHSIAGVINKELASAVCEGYAKMYQLLLNRYDIENILVCGIGNGADHAWNFVKMDDGNYYATDVTWDDTTIAMENGVDTSSYQCFNAPAQAFEGSHIPNQAGDDIAYYAALPKLSDSYAYTFCAQNGGLISESMILDYTNGVNASLIDVIAQAIRNYRGMGSMVYLYTYSSQANGMAQYGEVIGNAIAEAASTLKEFASGFSYSMYMLENEYIVDFGETIGGGSGEPEIPEGPEEETGPIALALYKNGQLIGEYVGLGSVFANMTDENGNYEVQFDPEVNNHFYIPESWDELPKVRSVKFSGGKQELGVVFYTTAIEITSDFTMSGDVTLDCLQFVGANTTLYLENTRLHLNDYARVGTDICAENAEIYAEHENSLDNLYGDCDITINGHSLVLRENAEIDTLTVNNVGRLELMGLANQDYRIYTINKIISEYDSPIKCYGNNHDIRIGEVDLTGCERKTLVFNIQPSEGNLLPKINIDRLIGVESIKVHYILSAFLSYTDSETGEEVGTQLVVLDKSVLKNNDGYILTCPGLNLNQVLATYSADEEWGVLVVNQRENSFYVDVDVESEVTWCDLYGHSSVAYDEAVDPTCTEGGLTYGTHCTICNKVLVEQQVVDALGHWNEYLPGQSATCTEDGYTDGVFCKRCGFQIKGQESIPSTGIHTYVDDTDTNCEVCGYVREVAIKTTPMYRLYNPNSGEHFYTGSVEEREMLITAGWTYEGIAWNAPVSGGTPVHRLYNPNSGDHHYTMSPEEIDMLVSVGWIYENVAWNSASAENVPMYRLYNPNADCGSHHYTGSTEERDFLVSLGWHDEGIGWFGMLR